MKFDESVLREADIRGKYPEQLNSEFAMRLGKVFGTYVRKNKADYCVVGHDNRFGGPDLTKNLIEGLLSTGVNVIYIGLVTTPMLNYASRRLGIDYGICVTASHNPKNDNGFKLFGKYALHCSHEDLDYIYNALKDPNFKIKKGDGDLKHIDVSDAYAQAVAESTVPGKKNLKVVVDPGNGTGSVIVKKGYDQLPYKVT
jgi:phosphomannomutase/phosphoglucomutase